MFSHIPRVALVLLIAGSALAEPSAKDQQSIRAVEKRAAELRAAILRGDAAAMAPMLTADFIRTPPTSIETPKAVWLEEIGSGRMKYVSIEQVNPRYRAYGDTVIEDAETRITYRRGGPEQQVVLRILHVWVKQNGQWILASIHGNEAVKP